jgi:hypothetical protein
MSPNPAPLRQHVDVRQHYLRSANLEHHQGETHTTYIPTSRSLEVLHRIVRAIQTADAGRAWSLTGPYGAGKSSFGLFLHALLGPANEPGTKMSQETLSLADPGLAETLSRARGILKADDGGFIRAAATAQREPIVDTVLRALRLGAAAHWKGRMPPTAKRALADAGRDRTPRSVTIALETLAAQAPVLLLIDEFGKNLEYFADSPDSADLYVLQELAERCTGKRAIPAFLVTLQHLAFDDYVRTASGTQRREWGKIQGRFEDIPFIEGSHQTARLVAAAFTARETTGQFERWRASWAKRHVTSCEELGIMRLIPGGPETVAACYPLHPLTLLALPDMCARFGQHGRTLFSFLTSREPNSVVEFLDTTPTTAKLASVGLDRLFDFFVSSGGATSGPHAARLNEISVAIREATGLTNDELRFVKTIGVLNLLSQGGPLRASQSVLHYALGASDPVGARGLRQLIGDLERRGLLTYRSFADEYRIWQGSDLDLPSLVAQAREELAIASPASLLSSEHKMPVAVAGRHSQRVGMLRYFDTCFADENTPIITRPSVSDAPDGLIVYFLGPIAKVDKLIIGDGEKPVVTVTTEYHHSLIDSMIELAAIHAVLAKPEVQGDVVARRELQDRASDARRRLSDNIAAHLHPDAEGVAYRIVGHSEPLPRTRSLSRLLSDLCDEFYYSSPEVRNEMLARRELSSQAAKARRELLEGMISHESEEWLGFTGFGPEKAMYAAALRYTGIHRAENGSFGFHPPKSAGRMASAWKTMANAIDHAGADAVTLDSIYNKLMAPPIGLKEGPIPVLLTAFLLYRSEDIAIYQEGTYQPIITAELLERLVKSPTRFSLRGVPLQDGRSEVLVAAASAIERATGLAVTGSRRNQGRRNPALLAVVGPLLSFVRNLPPSTLKTHKLSSDAEAVREAILNTREPETLLFDALPSALGLKPFGRSARGRASDIGSYQDRMLAALVDLREAYDVLLDECSETLAAEMRVSEDLSSLRTELRGQATSLSETLLEPRLRSFVLLASRPELDDRAWLEAVANNIAGRPPANWVDSDVDRFEIEVRALAGAWRRVMSLHYEALAEDRQGFDARRITITRPDGSEQSTVVWVDHADKQRIEQLVHDACASVQAFLGAAGGQALLALLAETVLGGCQDAPGLTEDGAHGATARETRHA